MTEKIHVNDPQWKKDLAAELDRRENEFLEAERKRPAKNELPSEPTIGQEPPQPTVYEMMTAIEQQEAIERRGVNESEEGMLARLKNAGWKVAGVIDNNIAAEPGSANYSREYDTITLNKEKEFLRIDRGQKIFMFERPLDKKHAPAPGKHDPTLRAKIERLVSEGYELFETRKDLPKEYSEGREMREHGTQIIADGGTFYIYRKR